MESIDAFVTRLASVGATEDEIVEEALALPDVARWVAGDGRRANLVETAVRATWPGFPATFREAVRAPAREVPQRAQLVAR